VASSDTMKLKILRLDLDLEPYYRTLLFIETGRYGGVLTSSLLETKMIKEKQNNLLGQNTA